MALHPTHRHLVDQQAKALVQEEARLAGELQKLGATRTQALHEAARLIRLYGHGLTLGPLDGKANGPGDPRLIDYVPNFHGGQ